MKFGERSGSEKNTGTELDVKAALAETLKDLRSPKARHVATEIENRRRSGRHSSRHGSRLAGEETEAVELGRSEGSGTKIEAMAVSSGAGKQLCFGFVYQLRGLQSNRPGIETALAVK